jgi:hypothetical protein
MPIQHSLWRVGSKPQPLREASLPSEALLEEMIVAAPNILAGQWMIIGRQVDTGFGGRIDLLALAPDGALILIELKRERTPREVVAQAIDYASWAERLEAEHIKDIYAGFSRGGNLDEAFATFFGRPLDPETLNQSHEIVIVASTLDASSERIVGYLNRRDIPINVLCFQVFEDEGGPLLSRAWLLDPVETQVAAVAGGKVSTKEPWNGEYYANFLHGPTRNWEEARRFGFISAGGGSWYSGTLRLLQAGDRIWVNAPNHGFVGVGRVRSGPVAAADFKLVGDDGVERAALKMLTKASYHRDDDPERRDMFVPVDWAQTRSLSDAVNERGLFGNQNTVCKPTTSKWRHTVERLKQLFPDWEKG